MISWCGCHQTPSVAAESFQMEIIAHRMTRYTQLQQHIVTKHVSFSYVSAQDFAWFNKGMPPVEYLRIFN